MDTASAPDPLPPPWWSPGPAPLPPPPPSLLFLLMHAPPAYFRRARGEPTRVASGERTLAVRPLPQAPEAHTGERWSWQNARERWGVPPCTWLIEAQRSRARVQRRERGGKSRRRGARRGRRHQVKERRARRRTCRDAHVRRAERAPRRATQRRRGEPSRAESDAHAWAAPLRTPAVGRTLRTGAVGMGWMHRSGRFPLAGYVECSTKVGLNWAIY
jgi:hypothetical protein